MHKLVLSLLFTATLFAGLPGFAYAGSSPKSWLSLDGTSGVTVDKMRWTGGSGTLQVGGFAGLYSS